MWDIGGRGMIIGPAVGGALSAGERYALPAFTAAALAFLNLGTIFESHINAGYFAGKSGQDRYLGDGGDRGQRLPPEAEA